MKAYTSAAAGLFDGVHLGHRAVISRAVSIAEEENITPAVFTFDTGSVSYKGGAGLLLTKERKAEELKALGAEYIYSPAFEDIKDLSAEEFVAEILRKKMNARFVVCGEDFRFGRDASGDVHTLERLCAEAGIKVVTVPPVKAEGGTRISSTEIRRLIADGKIAEANKMLGYEYYLKLPVEYGDQIGRTINFPTANQHFPDNTVIPRFGVYASGTEIDGKAYRCITNIGVRPTVSDKSVPVAETHIINFEGDLYGKTLRVSLTGFIRPERKFADINELKAQIEKDIYTNLE